ncbi:MAG TPA: polyprenol monophosphomannose synthase [Bryobacteraceae bacterium]|jgi:dolichol-phosphate mannosyltransferase|nr:polyprenol monophosphomannose synthase [Bryobacteraceae bacterium]
MAVESFADAPAGPLTVARRPPVRQQARPPLLSVVVPTYNEAANIGPFLEALKAGLDPVTAGGYEVIVVDDESPDGTGEVATRISASWPDLRVVRRTGERGLASAVVRGWQIARGDVLATINADFQHPPSILPEMFLKIENADLIVATRYAAEGSVGRFPLHRQFLSASARRVGAFLVPKVFRRVSDPLSGCYMFRRQAIEDIELRPTGFKTLIEILARGRVENIAECGYTMQKRRSGRSNVRVRHWFAYLEQLRRIRGELQRRRT